MKQTLASSVLKIFLLLFSYDNYSFILLQKYNFDGLTQCKKL